MKGFLIFIGSFFLAGCATHVPKGPMDSSAFPLKIGLVADTQRTTANETFEDRSFRSPDADKVSAVSLRPPALETLSMSLLGYFLEELQRDKVDLVLFLGDAANSGCDDELSDVVGALSNFTSKSGIPTYILIGNHDYLGTGNQTKRSIRSKLCNDIGVKDGNSPIEKYELIRIISAHNKDSSNFDKNFDYLESLPNLDVFPLPGECDESHNHLYYAAALRPKVTSDISTDILLADTSDYRNVWFRPVLKWFGDCEVLGGAGLKGSMSFEQINELESLGCSNISNVCDHKKSLDRGENPQFGINYRIVASHYDPESFNAVYPWSWSPSFVKDNLGYLLSDGENIWLGAHHHYDRPKVRKYRVGKSIFKGPKGIFHGFSVGSTTDYFPHAAVIEPNNWHNESITKTVGYRSIKAPRPEEKCREVFDFIESNVNQISPLSCMLGNSSVAESLGVSRVYEAQGCWNRKTYDEVRRNITNLEGLAKNSNVDVESLRICLAVISAHEEAGIPNDE